MYILDLKITHLEVVTVKDSAVGAGFLVKLRSLKEYRLFTERQLGIYWT